MTLRPLKVAVVGHTNTGKTSLMRTLLRDPDFGDVSDRPATTRHVEGAALLVQGQPLIELYDTPGLEDSSALLDHLDALRPSADRRSDPIALIDRFLAAPEVSSGSGRFAQEAKSLRQVLASDIALYVIDSRDRVLGKHRDELEILTRCARPVVPVLNFTASEQSQTNAWREHLARTNLHAIAEFDTVVLDEGSERRLLDKLRTLLDRHQDTINALIEDRRSQRIGLIRASCELIADMLIDVAGHAVTAPAEDVQQSAAALEGLRDRIRRREQQCVEQLIELHRFRLSDFRSGDLPLTDGRWGIDLFSPAALKQFGIRAGGAAAAGALAGLTIDAALHGISLGAATALGAAIGALAGAAHTHGRRAIDRARGYTELRCDDPTLRLLIARQISLLSALLRRGHASLNRIWLQGPSDASRTFTPPRSILRQLDEAKIRQSWSRLQPHLNPTALSSLSRRQVQDRLAMHLESLVGQ